MNVAYLALGGLVLVGAIVDLLWTTLWNEGGAGPITTRVMGWTWVLALKTSGGRSRLLRLMGPTILVLTLIIWIGLIWLGWTVVFGSAEGAIYDVSTGATVSWADRAYFTGYSIFTLGNGGFAPRGSLWQFATVLMTASGMLLVTLSVTYLLSVLDAVTQKHAFADDVTGLGQTPAAFARAFWNGDQFAGLDLQLNTLATQIATLTANHRAYPILHYFYSEQPENDPVVAIVLIDEALTLLLFGVTERRWPSDAHLESTRSNIGSYLGMLDRLTTYDHPADRDPPTPEPATLREEGVPTTSNGEFVAALEEGDLKRRRRRLLGLIEANARQWPVADGE